MEKYNILNNYSDKYTVTVTAEIQTTQTCYNTISLAVLKVSLCNFVVSIDINKS